MQKCFDLDQVLEHGNTLQMLNRKTRVLFNYDIPNTIGYSVDGLRTYIDRDFISKLHAGQIRVPQMAIAHIESSLLLLARTEKAILDSDSGIDSQEEAKRLALVNANRYVSQYCLPTVFEGYLHDAFTDVAEKPMFMPPRDLACAVYLDEDGTLDRLLQLQRLGVVDAGKYSKTDVAYQDGTHDVCRGCQHFEPLSGQAPLATCEVVDGTVHMAMWCERFVARKR